MPIFIFWYTVFLVGGSLGASAGLSFGNGFAAVVGLLSGMAVLGWIAAQLSSRRWLWTSQESLLQSEESDAAVQGLERIRLASARLKPETSEIMYSEYSTLAAFSLPKGMSEFAVRKQREKRISAS